MLWNWKKRIFLTFSRENINEMNLQIIKSFFYQIKIKSVKRVVQRVDKNCLNYSKNTIKISTLGLTGEQF